MQDIKYEFIEVKLPEKIAEKIRDFSKDLNLSVEETIVLFINRSINEDKSDLVYYPKKSAQ